MSLQDQIRQLYTLEQQIRGMQRRLDVATRRLEVQQSKLDQFNQQRDELHSQVMQTQAKASALENQSNDVETRIGHLRQQMQTVKSNKEYSAVLIEVNTLKIEKSKLEDEALEQIDHVERLKEDLQQIETSAAEQKILVAGAHAEVDACRGEVGQELSQLRQRRAEAEQGVPEEVRTIFNRMAQMHDGEALAAVTEENRRAMEYSCGGCYMSIPVERVNTLMTRQDRVVLCPSCSRILYLDQELKASIGAK